MRIVLKDSNDDLQLKRASKTVDLLSTLNKLLEDVESKETIINIIHIRGLDVSQTLENGNHYVFEEVSSLVISIGTTETNNINKFSFEFDSGSTPTVLTLPSGMGYIGGAPTIEANAHYYFEIEKSYDGRYFCKYEKYTGGGSYIYPENNIITYEASSKLAETTSDKTAGLHTTAFSGSNGKLTISEHTFNNGVGTIVFSDDVTSIDKNAFYGCSGMTSIEIPGTVTAICPDGSDSTTGSFESCSGLTSITIPSGVTSIGIRAFRSCSNLGSIVALPTVAPTINGSTFGVKSNGTLYVPSGSDYSSWMSVLSSWTKVEQ